MKRRMLALSFLTLLGACSTSESTNPPDASVGSNTCPTTFPYDGDCPVACGTGQVCARSSGGFQQHVPTCLQTCTTAAGCPSGMRCVELFAEMLGTAVCISDTAPAVCSKVDSNYYCDFPPANCKDANTLSRPFTQQQNGVCGHELVNCPNGCVDDAADGGQVTDAGPAGASCR